MREAAGECFVQVGLQYGQLQTTDDYLRAAHDAIQLGGDCCYCAASLQIVERLRDGGHPGRRSRRADPVATHVDRRLQGGRQDARHGQARVPAGQGARERRRVRRRDRSRAGADRHRDRQAHLAGPVLDGRRRRLRRPVPVLDRHARLHRRATSRATPRCTATSAPSSPGSSTSAPPPSPSSAPMSSGGQYPQPDHVVPVADDVYDQFMEFLDSAD